MVRHGLRWIAATVAVVMLLVGAPQTVRATWNPFNADAPVESISFLNASTGLVTYRDMVRTVYKFDRGVQTGLLGLNGATELLVQDSDVAWCVLGRAIYRGDHGWTRWTSYDSGGVYHLVGASPGQMVCQKDGALMVARGGGLLATTGISSRRQLLRWDYLTSTSLFVLSDTGLYRSDNGGLAWELLGTGAAAGLYVDRTRGRIYIGNPLRVSTDVGNSWNTIPASNQYPFVMLHGTVFGAHDCSGAFYVRPEGNEVDAYRYGEDGYFHDLGSQLLADETYVFDGGAIVFTFGAYNKVTYDGMDGSLDDSVSNLLLLAAPPITVDRCTSSSDTIQLTIEPGTCLGIGIDSVEIRSAMDGVRRVAIGKVLRGGALTIPIVYTATALGVDSIGLRVHCHSTDGRGFAEWATGATEVTIVGGPAKLDVPSTLAFPSTLVDSTATKTLSIENSGCESLRIDSVISTNDTLFVVTPKPMPIEIATGKSVNITVTYHPRASGNDLESLEIGSNAGHVFVRMTGAAGAVQDVATSDATLRSIAVQSGMLVIRGVDVTTRVVVYDVLGREVLHRMIDPGFVQVPCSGLAAGAYFVEVGRWPMQRIVVP